MPEQRREAAERKYLTSGGRLATLTAVRLGKDCDSRGTGYVCTKTLSDSNADMESRLINHTGTTPPAHILTGDVCAVPERFKSMPFGSTLTPGSLVDHKTQRQSDRSGCSTDYNDWWVGDPVPQGWADGHGHSLRTTNSAAQLNGLPNTSLPHQCSDLDPGRDCEIGDETFIQ